MLVHVLTKQIHLRMLNKRNEGSRPGIQEGKQLEPLEMISTASWDFNAFRVNSALKRVWRGTSPLVLQRQASRDLSLLGVVVVADMDRKKK